MPWKQGQACWLMPFRWLVNPIQRWSSSISSVNHKPYNPINTIGALVPAWLTEFLDNDTICGGSPSLMRAPLNNSSTQGFHNSGGEWVLCRWREGGVGISPPAEPRVLPPRPLLLGGRPSSHPIRLLSSKSLFLLVSKYVVLWFQVYISPASPHSHSLSFLRLWVCHSLLCHPRFKPFDINRKVLHPTMSTVEACCRNFW